MSKFVFKGRELDTETWECTRCGYKSTIRSATEQERASYSFRLNIVSVGYGLCELNFTGVSYMNYKFLSELTERFDNEIENCYARPDIDIVEPYCELFADPKTLHKCERAPVALTEEESLLDEFRLRRKKYRG